jgi:hypothetical protein
MKDSDSHERFWRPPCCRYINDLYGTPAETRTPIPFRSKRNAHPIELRGRVLAMVPLQGLGP